MCKKNPEPFIFSNFPFITFLEGIMHIEFSLFNIFLISVLVIGSEF